jgi:hypothetical protein
MKKLKYIFLIISGLIISPAFCSALVYQFNATDTASILSTAGGLVGDFLPIIVIFVGITIAFMIWDNITHRK